MAGQFDNPPIVSRPKGQDRMDSPEMPTRQRSTQEISTGSQTGIVPEDYIMEHTSDPVNANNEEEDDNLTPPLGLGTTAGGGDDNGDDSSSSSIESSSGSSVHS